MNVVMFGGRLGADPEMRVTGGGTSVCNLSVAVDGRRVQNAQGNWENKTEWLNVTVFGKAAEAAAQYTKKGAYITGQGRLETTKVSGRDGSPDRYFTKVIVEGGVDFSMNPKPQPQPARVAPQVQETEPEMQEESEERIEI